MPYPSIPLTSRSRRLRLLLFCIGLGVAAGKPLPAAGQKPAADAGAARAHFVRGEALFRQGQYALAYEAFAAGYDLSRRPLFLINMAHAQRRQGALQRAEALYRRFLLVAPESPLRAQVESVLEQIELVNAVERASAQPARPQPARPQPAHPAEPVPAAEEEVPEPAEPVAPLPAAEPTPVAEEPTLVRWPQFDGNRLPTPSVPPAPDVDTTPVPATRFYRKPWFWMLAGSLVAGGVGVGWAFRPGQPDRGGTLGALGVPR